MPVNYKRTTRVKSTLMVYCGASFSSFPDLFTYKRMLRYRVIERWETSNKFDLLYPTYLTEKMRIKMKRMCKTGKDVLYSISTERYPIRQFSRRGKGQSIFYCFSAKPKVIAK